MERLANKEERRNGLTRSALRIWGLLFAGLGIVGRAIVQNQLLGMGSVTGQQLLEAMMASETTMMFATLALVLQAVETCAVPIFAFLLVEGVQHTKDFGKYFLRVLSVALISELPYNLAMGGSFWDPSSRNPVFGLVLSLVMLYLYKRYEGKGFGKVLLRIAITLAAVMWPAMLKIQDGAACVVIVAVLHLSRNLKQYRSFIGCGAAACCTAFSPFYLAAPMGFLAVHFYRGERGDENKLINYLAYPVLLLAAALAGRFI